MSLNRDQELWGVALWVEREHGDDGPAYIADQVTRLALIGDVAGGAIWRAVAERYDRYCQSNRNLSPIDRALPVPHQASGHEVLPLGQCGRASGFVGLSVDEVAF